jgi:hypothetical protein
MYSPIIGEGILIPGEGVRPIMGEECAMGSGWPGNTGVERSSGPGGGGYHRAYGSLVGDGGCWLIQDTSRSRLGLSRSYLFLRTELEECSPGSA